ncbi:MAG: hypothetical protein OEX22_03605 [Cyclobacteriaceae bacterium]|nr:hypothetical protein [Cyclobacteriaceae bacterium]
MNLIKINILALVVIASISSSCKEDEPAIICPVEGVIVEGGNLGYYQYTFDENGTGNLSNVLVSSDTSFYNLQYTYTNNVLSRIKHIEGTGTTAVQTKYYDVVFNGTEIDKFTEYTITDPITNTAVLTNESRFVYSNGTLVEFQSYMPNSTGTFFKIGHLALSVTSGNITKKETHIDLASVFSLLFGQDPASYAPVLASTEDMEHEGTPNPLNGNLIPFNIMLGMNTNNITSHTVIDINGVSSTNTYTYNYDNGNGRLLFGTNTNGQQTTVLYTNCVN